MDEPEDFNPDCLQITIYGVGRMIDGGLIMDTGPGGAIQLMSPGAVSQLIEQHHIDPDGQRIMLRLAFLDFVPSNGG